MNPVGALVILLAVIASGCAISTKKFIVSSKPIPASIEVYGKEVCSATPCEFELRCKEGWAWPIYTKKTGKAFFTAFPKDPDGKFNPQYSYREVCSEKNQPEEVNFDLNLPKEGDFISGSNVPTLFKKRTLFSFVSGLNSIAAREDNYSLGGFQIGHDFLFSKGQHFQTWSSWNIFSVEERNQKDRSRPAITAFGISNIYRFYSNAGGLIHFATGPEYFKQYYGNEDNTFAIYVGTGFSIQQLVTKLKIPGDLGEDAMLDIGYLFQVSAPCRSYGRSAASLVIYF